MSSDKIFVDYKGKNGNFMVESPRRHDLVQVIKVNFNSNETDPYQVSPDVTH